MCWRKAILNPFILGPLLAGVMGNLSLGLITAGLTVLIWGFSAGINFITLTTILLVTLTGNINLEIIFIYSISLAFIIREGKVLSFINNKLTSGHNYLRGSFFNIRNLIYLIAAFISVILYQGWVFFLGLIPTRLLNELNIAGEIMVLAGLLLTLYRGQRLVRGLGTEPDPAETGGFIEFILILITAVLGLRGSWLVFPIWLAGVLFLKLFPQVEHYFQGLQPETGYLLLLAGIIYTSYLILPLNIYLTTVIIVISSLVILRLQRKIPLIETVYVSVIVGIIAGRLGLLS